MRYHQYVISALVLHKLIRRETTGGVIRYWLCSQAIKKWHCCNIIFLHNYFYVSLRKQPPFGNATTGFLAKWRLRNERRNSILMTRHYLDLGSASDWSCHVGNLIQPIRRTTQIWVMMPHQHGISALVYQTSLRGETSGSVVKCQLFSQAISMSTYSKWICLLPGDWCPPWCWPNSLRKGLRNSN